MFLQLILGIVLQVASTLLRPKPKQEKNRYVQDIKSPQASAGIPIPVVFGSMTIKSPNALYFGQAFHYQRDSTSRTNSGK